MAKNHYRADRLTIWIENTLPHSLLIILFPIGFLSVTDIRRRVIVAFLLLFLVAYAMYVFFLDHYTVGIIPSMIVLLLLGWESVRRAWPGLKNAMTTWFIFGMGGALFFGLPEFNRYFAYNTQFYETRAADDRLDMMPRQPAVVLFHFDPSTSVFHDEPAYNDDVAWPDDALIVRARDLGEDQNWKLFAYYAQRQPDRMFYIYMRGVPGDRLSPPLGTARELAEKHFALHPEDRTSAEQFAPASSPKS